MAETKADALVEWMQADPLWRVPHPDLDDAQVELVERLRRTEVNEYVPVQMAVKKLIRQIAEVHRQITVAELDLDIRRTEDRVTKDRNAVKNKKERLAQLTAVDNA